MDIGRALTFYTEDERWIEKTAIGAGVILVSTLLSMILVGFLGFFIVGGYTVRLLQNVRDEVHPVLPEWDQWGDDFMRGLKLFVVAIVWALPIILITVPLFIVGALASGAGGNSDAFASLLFLCATCLLFLLVIAYTILEPGFTIAFAEREEISDALQVARVWGWTMDHIGDVVIVAIVYWVGSMIISTVASLAGLILCLVGIIVTLPLGQLIIYYFQFHLYGQLARSTSGASSGTGFGEAPPPVDEPPAAPTPPQLIS